MGALVFGEKNMSPAVVPTVVTVDMEATSKLLPKKVELASARPRRVVCARFESVYEGGTPTPISRLHLG